MIRALMRPILKYICHFGLAFPIAFGGVLDLVFLGEIFFVEFSEVFFVVVVVVVVDVVVVGVVVVVVVVVGVVVVIGVVVVVDNIFVVAGLIDFSVGDCCIALSQLMSPFFIVSSPSTHLKANIFWQLLQHSSKYLLGFSAHLFFTSFPGTDLPLKRESQLFLNLSSQTFTSVSAPPG
jgi:hypothetical protein